MMGERTVMQEALFYEFSLERHVPADHLLRSIDRFVDLSGIREQLRPFYSEIGPALDRSGADDPDADRRLLLRHPLGAAAVRGGASEPRLSLVLPARAWRATCRTTRPSRRTGTAASATAICCASCSRRRCARCIDEGLVGGEGFAVDASLIKADANRQRSAEGSEPVDWEAMAETRRSVQRVSRRARRCGLGRGQRR